MEIDRMRQKGCPKVLQDMKIFAGLSQHGAQVQTSGGRNIRGRWLNQVYMEK